MAKYVSENNVNNTIGENYGERETGMDKNSLIQVLNYQKNLKKTKLPSVK